HLAADPAMNSAIRGEEIVMPDAASLATRAAEWLVARIAAKRSKFRLVLSGGSTPRGLYALLGAQKQIDSPRAGLFWGDESFFRYDDPESIFSMARETLLSNILIPSANIHPMPVDGDPADAARRYEALLKNIYGGERLDPSRPLFDILLLGLGSDGH